MSKDDAEDAANRADKTYSLCKKLIVELETIVEKSP